MSESPGMKLVFRVCGIGFALPLGDLVEVAEELTLCREQDTPPELGDPGPTTIRVWHRGVALPLRDIAPRFGLAARDPSATGLFLILVGDDGPWALAVDRVEGICPEREFSCVPVPVWFFRDRGRPFNTLAVWRQEPLVVCEAPAFERMLWHGER